MIMFSLVVSEEVQVPEDLVAEYMNQDILISNPLLDYAYSRKDVENMVISTTRSHKDSEEYSLSGEDSAIAYSSSML